LQGLEYINAQYKLNQGYIDMGINNLKEEEEKNYREIG